MAIGQPGSGNRMKPMMAETWISIIHPNVGSSPRAGRYHGQRQGCSLEISEASRSIVSGEGVTAVVVLCGGSVGHDRGPQARVAQQRAIGLDVRVAGGEQLFAVEDRVRSREEAQQLRLARQGQ